MDSRVDQLARLLVRHSCQLRPGEKVLIEAIDAPEEVVSSLLRAAKEAGATPLLSLKQHSLMRELCELYSAHDIQFFAACELELFKRVDAFISIRAAHHQNELRNVPPEKLANMLRHYIKPVHYDYRNEHLRWVALRWPTAAMAESAGMSVSDFEDFFFQVCNFDYARLDAAMTPLSELMARTDSVRITGAGTDLYFSIAGMANHKSVGRNNIPDGELFTAPLKNSVQGRIRFNVPSNYYGFRYEDVSLEFRDGHVVSGSCNDSDRLNQLLDQDEGARYVGEFAFGLHPHVERPIGDLLFDEKIGGSIHLALGNAYPNCDNGNKSAIHWDLILNQHKDLGGGEIYFDGRLVSKNGLFVVPELAALNPELSQAEDEAEGIA